MILEHGGFYVPPLSLTLAWTSTSPSAEAEAFAHAFPRFWILDSGFWIALHDRLLFQSAVIRRMHRMGRPAFLLALLLRVCASEDAVDALCGGLRVYVHRLPPPEWHAHEQGSFRDIGDHQLAQNRSTERGEGQESVVQEDLSLFGFPCTHFDPLTKMSCETLHYLGMGKPFKLRKLAAFEGFQFFATHQFAMQVFAVRYVLNHCATEEVGDAQLFLVPLPLEMIQRERQMMGKDTARTEAYMAKVKHHLSRHPAWRQRHGRDHLLVVSETLFMYRDNTRRSRLSGYTNADPFWESVAIWSIEGPRHDRVMNLPYLTFFHPKSDEEIAMWIHEVQKLPRERKVVLLAHERPQRRGLIEACRRSELCDRYEPYVGLDDMEPYEAVVTRYLRYTFALHPAGDTPTRRGFFDSIICGTIPIIFWTPEPTPLAGQVVDRTYEKCYGRVFQSFPGWLERVAFIASSESDALRIVKEASDLEIEEKQRNMREFLPRVLYWDTRWKAESTEARHDLATQNPFAEALREMKLHPFVGKRYGNETDQL
eukprot:scaffold572_cov141-Pinguiococcus_pyrenoidosus.AAC.2